jgi:hypothetical protein
VELDDVQQVEVEVDGGPEANARQEVELEVDAGPEVNRRQRRVGDEYAMGGIRLQSRKNTCRHQVYCLQKWHMRSM